MGSKVRMVYPYPKGRRYQDESRVSFRAPWELKLGDNMVTQKSIKPVKCLHELGLLLTCMKENMYVEKECLNEINDFYTCNRKGSPLEAGGTDVVHEPEHTPKATVKQINKIFEKYRKY